MVQNAQTIVQNKKDERNSQAISFPTDLGSFFFTLDFYDYRSTAKPGEVNIGKAFSSISSELKSTSDTSPFRRIYNADKNSVNASIKSSSYARIKLPIPGQLTDNFGVNYEDTQLSSFLAFMTETLSGALTPDQSKDAVQRATTGVEYGVGRYIGKNLLGEGVSDLIDLSLGSAINPNIATIFRGPTLKRHQFRWRLAPRSSKESQNIKKIIAIIKRAMHPAQLNSTTSSVLRFPSEVLPKFVSIKPDSSGFLYPMRPCVVEDFVVNYAPNNNMSLFQETYDPTVLEITLRLKETSYYTKESFDNSSEYGSDGFQTSTLTNATK